MNSDFGTSGPHCAMVMRPAPNARSDIATTPSGTAISKPPRQGRMYRVPSITRFGASGTPQRRYRARRLSSRASTAAEASASSP